MCAPPYIDQKQKVGKNKKELSFTDQAGATVEYRNSMN